MLAFSYLFDITSRIFIHADVLDNYICRYKQDADTRAPILQKQLNRYASVSLDAEVLTFRNLFFPLNMIAY